MKKQLYILFFSLIAIQLNAQPKQFSQSLASAGSVLLNFESAVAPSTISYWKNYAAVGTSASVWSAANPMPDAINSTSRCYKITKSATDVYWTGLEIGLTTPVKITTANRYLHVLVYKTSKSRIALTYTPTIGAQSADVWKSNSSITGWYDYVLPIPLDSTIKAFSIKIADDAGDYYFDEITLSDSPVSLSRWPVAIDPLAKNQVLEGWGVSLCWWANVEGGRCTDAQLKQFCDYLTDPVNGLNMNIFRYNIGGGDDPSHTHLPASSAMPGFKDSPTAAYNWTRDANQRRVAKQLIASRIAAVGVNDIQWVAFSNSPPYWMTNSGCVGGSLSTNAWSTNLKSTMYADFADYLTEVVKYYHDNYGITFNYIEPFNEPDGWWWNALSKKQEGCYFDRNDQVPMIRQLYAKLQSKNMLSYCQITANDENSMGNFVTTLNTYKNAGDILPKIPLLAVHSYRGTDANRASIATFAKTYAKKLWQSETGGPDDGDANTSYKHTVMTLSDRLVADLRNLKCTAWCDWQAGSAIGGTTGNIWGLIDGMNQGAHFYIRSQYSRYLKAGYTIINNDDPTVLTALSPDNKQLVIVVSNQQVYIKKYLLDLSKFENIGLAKRVLSRADPAIAFYGYASNQVVTNKSIAYDAPSESVATFLVPINQPVSGFSDTKSNASIIFYNNGFLHYDFSSAEPKSIIVYNSLGQLVEHFRGTGLTGKIHLSLKPDIYIVSAKINEGEIVKKIVVH